MFRPHALEGSHFSPSGAEGFTFRPRGPKGSRFSPSGAGGFVFLILGRRRVRIFRPWAPKGSHFWFLCAEGFTLLVLVCRRVRIFRTRVAQAPEGSIFLPGDQENLMFEKCVFLTWFEIKQRPFGGPLAPWGALGPRRGPWAPMGAPGPPGEPRAARAGDVHKEFP